MTDPTAGPPRHVWVDGRLEPAGVKHLSAFDRGFALGDAVFETIRAQAGHPIELPAHLDRLRASMARMEIGPQPDLDAVLAEAIAALLAAEGLDGAGRVAAVRVTLSRGAPFGRALVPGEALPPTLVVQAWSASPPPPELLARGLRLVVSSVRHDPRSPLAGVKSTSRADHVYARIEAARAGADDALLLTSDGHLAEATTATVFLVRNDELATPSLDCGILAGTTREWTLAWGARAGLRISEGWLSEDDLLGADEAFLASSVAGILPATRLGEHPIGSGRPGPWTMRARAAREAFAAGEG